MKKKSLLRMGAVLLSYGFMINAMNVNTGMVVMAEEFSADEDIEPEDTTDQDIAVLTDGEENTEDTAYGNAENQNVEETQDFQDIIDAEGNTENTIEKQTEIVLPQKSVVMPFSDFLPVQEQENIFLLNSYSDLYLLHIKNDSEVTYTISFNQALRESDVVLYLFDSEKNSVVDQEPVQDIMDFNENDTELCLNLKPSSDYVLTIFNAENYEKLGYTSRIVTGQNQKNETPAEEETGDSDSEYSTDSQDQSESEEVILTSVKLELDQDLETVPAGFAKYLNTLKVYSVTLIYSDGSEKILDKSNGQYDLDVKYEDEKESEKTVRRIYHATLKEPATGKIFEDTKSVVLGSKDPAEIKTEEMTTLRVSGKKKWIMVRSTPGITGRYALNSSKMVESIYYAPDDGEIVCTEDIFNLHQGIPYNFLIKLD